MVRGGFFGNWVDFCVAVMSVSGTRLSAVAWHGEGTTELTEAKCAGK